MEKLKEKISGVYLIHNKVDGKNYVGESENIKKRLSSHKTMLRKNKHINPHLQNAFNLYGEDSFEFILLEEYSKDLRKSFEMWWVNMLNSNDSRFGYNIRSVSPNGRCSHNAAARLKIAKSNREDPSIHQYDMEGNYIKTFTYAAIAIKELGLRGTHVYSSATNPNKRPSVGGYRWSFKRIDKLDPLPNPKLFTQTDEYRLKLKIIHKSKERSLYKIDPRTMTVVESYPCVRDAAKLLKLDPSYLSECCRTGVSYREYFYSYSDNPKDWKFKVESLGYKLTQIITGEVLEFKSMINCLEFFGLKKGSGSSFMKHFKQGKPYRGYIIKYRFELKI